MEQVDKQQVEQIIGQSACPKGVACHRSTFEVLCKAKDIGVESFVECVEEKPFACKFAVPFGYLRFSKRFGQEVQHGQS